MNNRFFSFVKSHLQWHYILILGYVCIIQAAPEFKIITLSDLLKKRSDVEYQLCHDSISFHFEEYPLHYRAEQQPAQGIFEPTFILTIPQGQVCSPNGWVLADGELIRELLWKDFKIGARKFAKANFDNLVHVTGKVAVLAQRGCDCYYHWLGEALGRLALLEMNNVSYDWLFIPCHKPYMKATLKLWGVDMSKVIDSADDATTYIQADELIVPSLVCHIQGDYRWFASYNRPEVIEYVQKKLLLKAEQQHVDLSKMSKKIFISRQDGSTRKVMNEDAVFELFEVHGFKRYSLSQLSIAEQIMLFHQAHEIVALHGAGLINLIFCKPNVHIVEIFQERGDATYWYLTQMLGLPKEYCVQTVPFSTKFGQTDTAIDLDIIKKLLQDLY